MKNYLIGTEFLEYAGLKLHARYLTSQDDIGQRLVGHEFIKVDGAYQEFMGSGSDSYRFALVFVGDSWRKDFVAAVAHFKKNPKGLLVHPVHGHKRVGWKSISAPINVGQETNAVTATVQFVEDNLDPAAVQTSSVATEAQAVTDTGSQLTDATSSASIPVRTAIGAVVLQSQTYAQAALAVAQGGPPDPTLPLALAGVGTGTTAALAAMAADPLVTSPATARTLALQLYSAALALDAAVSALQPTVETVTLGGPVSLSRLCADRYGSSASAMRDVVLALNRVPTPALIPAGTKLQMPTITV